MTAVWAAAFLSGSTAASAQVATPIAPPNGTTLIGAHSVVLSWDLPAGSSSETLSLAKRPETTYPGGPFLAPLSDAFLSEQDRAHLISNLEPGRYYWHVNASYCTEAPDEFGYCNSTSSYGPVARFTNLDALGERDARLHVRDLVGDQISEYVEISSNRCARVSKLRARCTFAAYIGDSGYTGRGIIFYGRDLRDNLRYYHFRFRVRAKDFYCRYGLHRPWRRCIRRQTWRG